MWMSLVYCATVVLNGCSGVYNTEGNPQKSVYLKTQQECRESALLSAKRLKAEYPDKDIRWTCQDFSGVAVQEDKR